MSKSSADLEREVEASRSDLDRNVEALKDKMTPGQLLDEAMHAMGGAGQQIGSKFLEQAKQNPMPLAVMGLGLAWLMASNKGGGGASGGETRSFAGSDQTGDAATDLGGRASDAAGALKDRASDLADQASDAFDATRSRFASSAATVKDSAGGLADKAGQAAQQAQQTVSQAFRNEPLLLGAAGLVLGLAMGAALPPTETENRVMGGARDRLVDKAKDVAQSGLDQAASAAKSGYQGAKSELQGDGQEEGQGELADRLARAVKTGVERAQQEIKPH